MKDENDPMVCEGNFAPAGQSAFVGGYGRHCGEEPGKVRFSTKNGESKFSKPAGTKSLGGHARAVCADLFIYSERMNTRGLLSIPGRQKKQGRKPLQGRNVPKDMDLESYYLDKSRSKKKHGPKPGRKPGRKIIAWERERES